VAAIFSGRARAARLASVNGTAAIVWAAGGQPRVIFTFTICRRKVTAINMTADPGQLSQLDVTILNR
jgi:hypothetical protein